MYHSKSLCGRNRYCSTNPIAATISTMPSITQSGRGRHARSSCVPVSTASPISRAVACAAASSSMPASRKASYWSERWSASSLAATGRARFQRIWAVALFTQPRSNSGSGFALRPSAAAASACSSASSSARSAASRSSKCSRYRRTGSGKRMAFAPFQHALDRAGKLPPFLGFFREPCAPLIR